MPNITIQANDSSGSFSAYLLEPKTKPAGVVVLIQEIFGVNQAMRDAAAWVADMGFIAVCPDLFWRIEPGIDITDKSKAEWDKAFSLFNAFDVDAGVKDIQAPIRAVRADFDAAVSYYGVGLEGVVGEAEKLTRPLMLHIAEEDGFVPKAAQAI